MADRGKQEQEPGDAQSSPQGEVKPDSTATHPGAPTSVEHTEPEKHFESGGQQKHQRAALEENVGGSQRHPAQPAGLHSTGSFTGKAEEPEDPSR